MATSAGLMDKAPASGAGDSQVVVRRILNSTQSLASNSEFDGCVSCHSISIASFIYYVIFFDNGHRDGNGKGMEPVTVEILHHTEIL